MSVLFDHRRRHGDEDKGPVHPRSGDGAPLWGLAYEKVEGVVHLTLAFTLVGGTALLLSSALFSPAAPPATVPDVATVENAPAPASPVQQALATAARTAAATPIEPTGQAEPAKAAPAVEPAHLAEKAAEPAKPAAPAADPFLNAQPLAEQSAAASALEPLAPPSPVAREKLASRDEAPTVGARKAAPEPLTRAEAAPAPESPVDAAPVDEGKPAQRKAAESGRLAKCFVKLSGRVQNSGACRVDHAGSTVVFHLAGKPLAITQQSGRVWTATLGGRSLGKVYRNTSAPCWGGKGFYACENG